MKPQTIPSREEVIETVIDIFAREIGFIERNEVSKNTNFQKDFKIHDEDISILLTMVVKHFTILVFAEGIFLQAQSGGLWVITAAKAGPTR